MSIKISYAIIYLIVFICPNLVNANCTFKTSDFINHLGTPKSITSINIKVAKSAKFNKNFAKIVTSKTHHIPPELKKKFNAIVKVTYKFGTCTYKASVKQHGDWKDHIDFLDGKAIRSLNVKLKDGNILNAVKFKLLLPKTRNNLDEILGTIILRELGFIAPETFEVLTDINGMISTMLFQEDAKKEMLERNKRREGPLFEGDESLAWSSDGRQFKYNNVLMSRMTNPNWFLLGESAESITLFSYNKLQQAFLEQTNGVSTIFEDYNFIFPNNKLSTVFQDYLFLMLAMNGSHALYQQNRKYYYNVFTELFEPVYYDGNLNLRSKITSYPLSKVEQALNYVFSKGYHFPYIAAFQNKEFINNIYSKFEQRLVNNTESKLQFVKLSLSQLKINSAYIQGRISRNNFKIKTLTSNPKLLQDYEKKVLEHKLIQKRVELKKRVDHLYLSLIDSKTPIKLTKKDIANIISNHTFNGERHIFLPHQLPLEIRKQNLKKYQLISGVLISDGGIHFNINEKSKIINVIQDDPMGWALFSSADMTDWTVNFVGKKSNLIQTENVQRFNSSGMTGCLNFYNTKFHNTSIYANNGHCEDTLNIINSIGNITNLNVKNSYADAVDLDFSELDINESNITNAGNDCLDVSSGSYTLVKAKFENCSDKGLSVGEMSDFKVEKISVTKSKIAIAVKDLSKVSISELITKNVIICIEASQKKQEFGGAVAMLNQSSCDGLNQKDSHSSIEENSF